MKSLTKVWMDFMASIYCIGTSCAIVLFKHLLVRSLVIHLKVSKTKNK